MITTLNTPNNIVLEDERVKLRPLELSDYEHLLPFSINEPDTWFYSLVGADGPDNLKNYISIAIANREKGMEYPFIVFDKLAQEYAGSTRFYDINQNFKTITYTYNLIISFILPL
jgi:RimJ/RimL family protein N-acetyltransferase